MNSLGFLEKLWQDVRLRSPLASEKSRIHSGRDTYSRSWHRREHRHVSA